MKTTKPFKDTILAHLANKSNQDPLFAITYAKPDKNIDDCITYILNFVQQSGCNGFTDEEVYSLAVHYYDEDNLEVGKPINCHVAVNHVVELSEEEKAQAKQKAIQQYQDKILADMKHKAEKKKTKTIQLPTLFD